MFSIIQAKTGKKKTPEHDLQVAPLDAKFNAERSVPGYNN